VRAYELVHGPTLSLTRSACLTQPRRARGFNAVHETLWQAAQAAQGPPKASPPLPLQPIAVLSVHVGRGGGRQAHRHLGQSSRCPGVPRATPALGDLASTHSVTSAARLTRGSGLSQPFPVIVQPSPGRRKPDRVPRMRWLASHRRLGPWNESWNGTPRNSGAMSASDAIRRAVCAGQEIGVTGQVTRNAPLAELLAVLMH
jgi:hypothetical protein